VRPKHVSSVFNVLNINDEKIINMKEVDRSRLSSGDTCYSDQVHQCCSSAPDDAFFGEKTPINRIAFEHNSRTPSLSRSIGYECERWMVN
jgi:hypothetical protein